MTAVIYWSGTGNTEAMAKAIEEGLREKGEETIVMSAGQADADVAGKYGKLALGCPSMGDEVLEESEFEPFFASIEDSLSGKKVALFGSYDWGDGQWMRDWAERVKAGGADLYRGEGLIQNLEPDETACKDFGAGFAAY